MKGLFISFEGPDGSGKTTHIRLLSEKLRAAGFDVLVTREPGGCRISEKIRELVLSREYSEMTAVTEALLYAASRAQHVAEVIRPALARGAVVITDRYVDSSIAYQGFGRGLGEDTVRAINEPATGGLLPDVTFFMSVDAKEASRRISDREQDRIELAGMGFQDRALAGFKLLSARIGGRIVAIDATRPKPDVHSTILAIVEARLL